MSTGMIIDGVLGSEAIDSSGEVLDVAGADISDVDKGTLLLNWEHEPGEKSASTLVGKVVSAKKIFTASDCENDRQRMYWNEIKLPFIYGVCRLYDGAGHPEAQRIAAIVRDHVANGEMVVCRFSVEGSTLEKDGNRLKSSVIRRVAVTVKPCNRTANSGLIEDPNAPDGFEKKHVKYKVKDLLEDAAKSELEHPLYQRLGEGANVTCNPLIEDGLQKATIAGTTDSAPSLMMGGAALQREHIGKGDKEPVTTTSPTGEKLTRFHVHTNKGRKVTWARHEDHARERAEKWGLKVKSVELAPPMLKTDLPEPAEDFIDHFADQVGDHEVKPSQLKKQEETALALLLRLQTLDIALRKHTADVQASALFSDPRKPIVYAIYVNVGNTPRRAGRFMLVNNELHHLEDYFDLLAILPEGTMSPAAMSAIRALQRNPNLTVQVEEPESEEQEQQADEAPVPTQVSGLRPPSVFEYHRAGMDKPHTLEVVNGAHLLDGSTLSFPEIETVLANVRSGAATVRYKSNGASPVDRVQKMEDQLGALLKADEQSHPGLMPAQDALAHIRRAVAQGLIPAHVEQALTRHIYEDPMMEGIGNKKAFQEFRSKNKPGVYMMLDGNDFSAVNNAFGHEVGDDALKATGRAMSDAMDKIGGHGKLFRPGGDETAAWFPSHEHAMKFARNLHANMEALPPVQGMHKLSMSMGLGTSPEHADKALYAAKDQKYLPGQHDVPARQRKRVFDIGKVPNLAHSLVPGHEGAVPLHNQQDEAMHATLKAPQLPKSTEHGVHPQLTDSGRAEIMKTPEYKQTLGSAGAGEKPPASKPASVAA